MPQDQIFELQKIIDRFQEREYYSHGFLIGTTNHWLSLLANKARDHLELFILDSRYVLSPPYVFKSFRNISILERSKEDLITVVKEHYDKKEKQGQVVDHRAWRESMYLQSLMVCSIISISHT